VGSYAKLCEHECFDPEAGWSSMAWPQVSRRKVSQKLEFVEEFGTKTYV